MPVDNNVLDPTVTNIIVAEILAFVSFLPSLSVTEHVDLKYTCILIL